METVACVRITFSFRNVQPWYFQKLKFKHRRTQRFLKFFENTSFIETEIMVKVRNRTDCTTAFRRTIAPVDDITLRVQPLYESCEWHVGAPQGIEIAPAGEFRDF